MKKRWSCENYSNAQVEEIAQKFNVSNLVAKVILSRKFNSDEEIAKFLNPELDGIYDPFLLNDMEKAVDRIVKAINNKEKMLIYGDYDVDGITSIALLKKFLHDLGQDVLTYLPNRLDEGYGLNKLAIDQIANNTEAKIIITVDCGISAIEEVDYAVSKGFEVIITDHHECGETLPNAYAIVDAKRKDSTYPFKQLAGVGVSFKLIQAISKKLGLDDEKYLKYLEIACIGTIADIVPLVDENRIIAKKGLELFKNTSNIGMKALLNRCGFTKVDSTTISFGLSPRINACGRIGNPEKPLELFLTDNEEDATRLANELNEANIQRQQIERAIFEDAKKIIEENNMQHDSIIVLGHDQWHHGVIGIVASKLVELYAKPCILICFEGEEGKASGRSLPNFDLFKAISTSSDLLDKYGGHEMAVGLTINRKNYDAFRERMLQYASEILNEEFVNEIKVDSEIKAGDISLEKVEELKVLEPFGEKNPVPTFIYKNLKIESIRTLSNDKHLKLELKDNQVIFDAIGFNLGHLKDLYICGDRVDVVVTLEINRFNNVEKVQFNIKDIMKTI